MIASRNAATPRVMTIAVSTRACTSASLIADSGTRPTSAAAPKGPPAEITSRLVALPSTRTPSSTRVRLRSSSR